MVQKRHPDVAHLIIGEMHQDSELIRGVVECEGILQSVGFDVPTWTAVTQGDHPSRNLQIPRGLCFRDVARVQRHRESVDVVSKWPHVRKAVHMFPHYERDSIRFSVVPPLVLTSARRCRCGRPFDPCGHHRSMCSSGSSGLAGFRSGVCCSAHVPRSRREGHDQHVGP